MSNTIAAIIKIMINKIKMMFRLFFKKNRLLYFIIFTIFFIVFLTTNSIKTNAQENNSPCANKPRVQYSGCLIACKDTDGSIICEPPGQGISMEGGESVTLTTKKITGASCKEEGGKTICSGGNATTTDTTSIIATAGGATVVKNGRVVGNESFITRIAAGVVGFVAFIINYIISIILGVVINFEAWLIEIILQLNAQVLQSQFVQAGYQISLAVANLIFVGGIITVAIATILRWESYSMKKILWHLILMTILVNFGLSIAGTIINISHDFSMFFLENIKPSGGANESHFDAFATAIAGAFTPQRFFITNISEKGVTTTPEESKNVAGQMTTKDQESLASMFGGSLAGLLTPIVSIFFTIAFLTGIIVVLGALVAMLIIRYIWISFLLILLPLAWALWVFPNTKKHWTTWWDKFLQWTFFTPITLFFLYLCLLTLAATPGGGSGGYTIQGINFKFQTGEGGVLGGLEAFGGSFLMNLLAPILNAIVMTACVVGSLKVGQAFSIDGAQKAEKIARASTKAVGDFALNRAKGLGAAGLTKILPKTPPKTTGTGLWGKTKGKLGQAWFGVSQQAEKFGVTQKLEETSKKYGPSTWPYLPKNFKQRREQAKRIKNEIDEKNNEIKTIMPTLLAKRQKELDDLRQNRQKIDSNIQKQENTVNALKARLETEMDLNKREEIEKELKAEEEKLNKLIAERKAKIEEIDKQIKGKEAELTLPPEEQKEIKDLIDERRKLYQEIRDLKPEGIFGTIINAGMEAYKPKKKKVKAPKEKIEKMSEEVKEQIEDLGIELETEEEKTNRQQQNQQKNQNQQSQTKKV